MSNFDNEIDCLPLLVVGHKDPKDKLITSFIASVIASLATWNFGFVIGYSSPTQKQMTSKDGVLTSSEFAWFSSIMALGAIIGSIIGGYLVETIGRKLTIMFTSLFYVVGWCLICYGKGPIMLYAGRIVSGAGVGMAALSVPMYISEIASSRFRGGLSSINQLVITFGTLVCYTIGEAISWQWLAIVPVFISVLAASLMAFMPQTPVWLLTCGKRVRAQMNLTWLRGEEYDSESELRDIETNLAQQEKMSFSAFLKPGLYRPLIIGCMLMFFQQFVGINVILFFCDDIFRTAGIEWNASILVGCMLFIFSIVACLFVDKAGRRVLLLVGSIGMFICMFLLGVYYDIAKIPNLDHQISIFGHVSHSVPLHNISWLATGSVIVYIIVFAVGWGPLPWVLMGELFPPGARGLAGSIVTIVNLLFTFVIAQTFDALKETFYQQGTFWFYAGFCLLSFLYTLFCVPETKGKTLAEIEHGFRGSTQHI